MLECGRAGVVGTGTHKCKTSAKEGSGAKWARWYPCPAWACSGQSPQNPRVRISLGAPNTGPHNLADMIGLGAGRPRGMAGRSRYSQKRPILLAPQAHDGLGFVECHIGEPDRLVRLHWSLHRCTDDQAHGHHALGGRRLRPLNEAVYGVSSERIDL